MSRPRFAGDATHGAAPRETPNMFYTHSSKIYWVAKCDDAYSIMSRDLSRCPGKAHMCYSESKNGGLEFTRSSGDVKLFLGIKYNIVAVWPDIDRPFNCLLHLMLTCEVIANLNTSSLLDASGLSTSPPTSANIIVKFYSKINYPRCAGH